MSSKKLSEFVAEIRKRGVSSNNLYYVEVIPPKAFAGTEFSGSDNSFISMFCHTASTPQTTIHTRDDYMENGVNRKYAYNHDYNPLMLSFYVDQEFKTKNFFDQWRLAIVPYRRKFNYPDYYTAPSLNVYIIDRAGDGVYKYEYKNIYPKAINMIDLTYFSPHTPMTFNVDFVYEDVVYTNLSESVEIGTSEPPSKINSSINGNIKNNTDSNSVSTRDTLNKEIEQVMNGIIVPQHTKMWYDKNSFFKINK